MWDFFCFKSLRLGIYFSPLNPVVISFLVKFRKENEVFKGSIQGFNRTEAGFDQTDFEEKIKPFLEMLRGSLENTMENFMENQSVESIEFIRNIKLREKHIKY